VAVSYPAPRVSANQRALAGAAAGSPNSPPRHDGVGRLISLRGNMNGRPDEWAAQLDRDIKSLRDRWSNGTPVTEESLTVLDTSFEELRVTAEEVREQSLRLETATVDAVKSRRRYALLLKLIGVVLETDEAGVIRDASPEAARLLEVRADFLVQKPLAVFIAGRDYYTFQKLLREVQRGSVKGRELLLQPREGPAVRMIASAVRAEAHDDDPATILWHLREPVDRAGDWRDQP
jgi:PAS domain-containing protein